jgi:hypothetical protein
MIARATVLFVCLVLLSISAGIGFGCGGDDDDGATAAGGAKAEFASKANAACAKESSGLMKRARTFEKRRAEADASPEPYVDMVHFVFLPTVEMQVLRIEQLKPPVGEAARVDALLDADRSAIDRVATMPRVPSIEVARRYFVEADKLFRAYGLAACANGPT